MSHTKMELKLSICVFLACIAISFCSVAREITDNTKEHPGYCFSKDTNVGAMEQNEIKQLNNCIQAMCGEGRIITYFGCGAIGAQAPCKVVEGDQSKPYPECCPDVKC